MMPIMRIWININKTPEQNAAEYYEKAKKMRRKIEGAKKALEQNKKKLIAGTCLLPA